MGAKHLGTSSASAGGRTDLILAVFGKIDELVRSFQIWNFADQIDDFTVY